MSIWQQKSIDRNSIALTIFIFSGLTGDFGRSLKNILFVTGLDEICETGDEWNGTRIRFGLEESKAETLLRFTHAAGDLIRNILCHAIRLGAS